VSNEAKIGLGVAILALAAVLWFASGRHETAQDPQAPGAKGARVAAPEGRQKPASERVKERLAQLRAERLAAAPERRPGGVPPFPGQLPEPALGQVNRDAGAASAVQEETSLADLEFEDLRDMALIDEDPDNRIAAIWLLASLEEEEPALPVLTQALSDEDPEVRMAAIQALSEFSEETPIESLHVALQDSDAEIRFEALSIAAEMSDERVQPLIAQALDDPDEDVRSLAEGLADMEEAYDPVPTPAP
jgi:hypothetical protein